MADDAFRVTSVYRIGFEVSTLRMLPESPAGGFRNL
jgi:hypothetical protein